VTLVVSVNGPESIWLMADRRLSYRHGRTKDDARKLMFLETNDGVAILGYAGLGATALGTEPADWMSAVLRGRNFSLERSLGVIAEAMKKQLPRHMQRLPGNGARGHNVIVPAFLGDELRLYTIDLALAPDCRSMRFRYTRHIVDQPAGTTPRTPRFAIGGSGGLCLIQDKRWMRSLLRIVKANDCGRVSPRAVADQLANLNNEVHLRAAYKSVGPRCIVAWRHKKGGVHKGGGGQQFYTGTTRETSSTALPTIGNGMDISALVGVLMPLMTKRLEAMRAGEPAMELDKDEINAQLARLPDKPDENLR